VELVTTMVLLAGAGLLAKSFYELLHVDTGFAKVAQAGRLAKAKYTPGTPSPDARGAGMI
jgi:hypothetical protein